MIKELILCLILISGFSNQVSAAFTAASPSPSISLTVNTKVGDLENNLGRMLTKQEKVAIRMIQKAKLKQLRKSNRLAKQGKMTADESLGNGFAIAGFVCGVVGLLVAGFILGTCGIVFGLIGMNKSKKEGRPLKGLALAGFICGIIGVLGAIIIVAAAA